MTNRHHPRYNDDADFTTNAPSYYEDLARKEKLIRLLAERIWGYEKILDETLEQIQERFRAWDKNLEDFPDDVKVLLQKWLDDGTLDHIINDTIFNWKLDTSIFEQFRDATTAQLQHMATLVTDYALTGETHHSGMFERAINSGHKNIKVPAGTYTIVRPLIIPDTVLFNGIGGQTIIKADFANWEGTDYRAIIIPGREGINREYNSYNITIGNFSLVGVGSELVKATGIFIGTDKIINHAVAVNHTFYNGLLENVYVEKFDTAYYIKECHSSNLYNIKSLWVRRGIVIEGKVVNLNVLCKLSNFVTTYTTDKTSTVGLLVKSKNDYLDGEGRPEGIVFENGCLIFGATNNIILENVLFFAISDSIIDGAKEDCVIIKNVDDVTIDNCYLFTMGVNAKAIVLQPTGTGYHHIKITNNKIVGTGSLSGLYAFDGLRYNATIKNNSFFGFKKPIQINNLADSIIENNSGTANTGTFITIQTGCQNTLIHRNHTNEANKIISVHTTTSAEVDIGDNWSTTTKTYTKGKVKILAGQINNTVANPFGYLNSDNLFPFIKFTSDSTANVKATQANNALTFTAEAIAETDITIYYEATLIPLSLILS